MGCLQAGSRGDRMFKLFLQPFQPASIHSKVDRFFELYKLSLAFALSCAPWIVLNFSVKFSLTTSLLYGLIALGLLPNVQTMIRGIHHIYEGKHYSFRDDLSGFWHTWVHFEAQRWSLNVIVVMLTMLLIGEFHLVMQANGLHFMLIPFMIIGAFVLAAVWNYLLLVALEPAGSIRQQISAAVYLSWRNPLIAAVSGLLVALWISVGYQIPSLNALLLNVVLFWLGYKLRYKAVARLVTPSMEVK